MAATARDALPEQRRSQSAQQKWQRELAKSWRSLDALKSRFPDMEITAQMREAEKRFPMAVTPHFASLVRKPDFSDPIFAQCVPGAGELISAKWLSNDPLGETPHSPTPRLVHRYPDRAVLLVSGLCAVYCRHCTRKRVSSCAVPSISDAELDGACAWLRDNPQVEDLLVSGGDPLLLSDARLREILSRLRAIPSLRVLRICSRVPVALPSRMTASLAKLLKPRAGEPVTYVNVHVNHPREISPAMIRACARLVDLGIPVSSQTVLLRGINDNPETIETLCRTLFHARIRPYYLFQCDLVGGVEHLRTSIDTGLAIMRHLRENLSGMAIPNFCLDPPGLAGKIELSPDCHPEKTDGGLRLVAGNGTPFIYPDPALPN